MLNFINCLFKNKLISFFLIFFFFLNSSLSFAQKTCEDIFSNTQSLNSAGTKNHLFHSHQKILFELYKNSSFYNPYKVYTDSFNNMMKILKENPELSKIPFREYIIHIKDVESKINYKNLEQFAISLNKSNSRVKNNLFKIKENLGWWKGLLDYPELDKEYQKDKLKKQQHNSDFLKHLDTLIDKESFEILSKSDYSTYEKSFLLYKILEKARNINIENNRSIKRISQAMVDAINIAGFSSSVSSIDFIKEVIKNKDLEMLMDTWQSIKIKRDELAQKLGFENFLNLQSLLEVEHPTGFTKNQNIEDIISSHLNLLESGNEIKNISKDSSVKILRIRPLSILEAPYRGCMGNDCSSRSYFEKAFDPNFHYFTLTDENNKSSGQITVVLGISKKEQKKIKTAFLDKIQNVPLDLILPMLKGIQFSLKEKDYILGIPTDVEGIIALSSTKIITEYVKTKIISNSTQVLEDFFPHSHQYADKFNKGYTRAYDKLTLVEVSEIATNTNYEITAG
ncbi:MAG: hypothetical protein OXC37_00880, partial [Bdellovibrionaceae bacterium]|nr:hypothetical protein [Pseudobdellovibrionaceae bacterium]